MKQRKKLKKERLVPLEKRKRVIYLDKRGYAGEKKKVPAVIFGLLAFLSFAYCASIAFFMGYGTLFFLIWGGIALVFAGLSYLMLKPDILNKIPKFIRRVFAGIVFIGIAVFLVIEGMIMNKFASKPAAGADYCIILGAQWKENGPSYVLKERLDAALEYLKENEGTIAIVSGGQGANESISEAAGMRSYLLEAGIPDERIIVEDKSSNTYENLVYSGTYMDRANQRCVLVTNNFHMFRALCIARRQGYGHPEGLSAGSYPAMLPNNLLREFFGVVKDSIVGNM